MVKKVEGALEKKREKGVREKGVTPILIDKKLRGGLAKNELLGQ